MAQKGIAVVFGVGPALGRSICLRFAKAGHTLVISSRNASKNESIKQEILALGVPCTSLSCDVSDESAVKQLFATTASTYPGQKIDAVVYNPTGFSRGGIMSLTPKGVSDALNITILGYLHVAQGCIPTFLAQGFGTILVTGATAALRGSAMFGAFAASKMGLRGMVQSTAREFHPQNIHVAHIIVDGPIGSSAVQSAPGLRDMPTERFLNPDAIADSYYYLYTQDATAWTHEMDLRTHLEKF
ncbi:hypothetical protein SmJEL517_g03965 [Synchytrium microbalum]|uniref:3-oxoacyl-[acyl-carrier-protein] reductase n=1 Tax=Synchytrium microbalum TaxID=1806994 RepID=A0A507C623_9FUNG|nr:uncharacterized protein SmJEL517_g03965 [Synchytrium microbalum]TPX32993.1 hypothetical protein SmJEL517_g03965 [Synchytrium microbalum]